MSGMMPYRERRCSACYYDGVELVWDIIRVVLPLAAAAQRAHTLEFFDEPADMERAAIALMERFDLSENA